ncbi:hypothetical protein OH492_07390 [Vibrio chagasii]|nr:hypothetical protein [Vibrio chagasii]
MKSLLVKNSHCWNNNVHSDHYARKNIWSLGVAASYSLLLFERRQIAVIPMIGYEGEHFFMRGPALAIVDAAITSNLVFRAVYDQEH